MNTENKAMSTTPISSMLLLELGFEERIAPEGPFFAKGRIGLVKNCGWIPCRVIMGQPKVREPYMNITTIEQFALLEWLDGINDLEVQNFVLQKYNLNQQQNKIIETDKTITK